MKCSRSEFIRGDGPNIQRDNNFWCDRCNNYPESLIVKTFYREYRTRGHTIFRGPIASIYVVKCHGSKFVIDDQEDVKRIQETLFAAYLTL